MEGRDLSESWTFSSPQQDVIQLSKRKSFGLLAKNPGSLPVMGTAVSTIELNLGNVDVNANMLSPLSQAFSATSAPHIAPQTPPTLARREGRVVLPRRYLLRLKEYRKLKGSPTSGIRLEPPGSQRHLANVTILEEVDPVDLDKTLSDADPDNITREGPQTEDTVVGLEDNIQADNKQCSEQLHLDISNVTDKPEIQITPPVDSTENTDSEDGEDSDTLKKSDLVSSKWPDRIHDMSNAVKWIRQEILQIKQEDRLLITRLLDLRARIHQLQGRPSHMSLSSHLTRIGTSSCSSDLNVAASWASFISLDERALEEQAAHECPEYLKDVVASFRDKNPTPDYGHARLAGYGAGVLSDAGLYRSMSSRETIRPHIPQRKKSLPPMASELEEEMFYDDDEVEDSDDL